MPCQFLILLLFALLSINVSASPFTTHLNQSNWIEIDGKLVKVESDVPITWKTFGNSSVRFGLVDEVGNGWEYEAKLIEKEPSKPATLYVGKRTSPKRKNGTNTKSSNSSSYSDEFARSTMLILSAAAYNAKPEVCLKHALANVKVHKNVTITCDTYGKYDICAGFTAVSHHEKAIILAFRGTSAFVQLVVETSQTVLQKQVDSPIGGKVGYYFADVFQRLWVNNSLGQDFEVLRQTYPHYDLWLTGHSLGGALASLAAARIVADGLFNVSKIKLYTFGQPRTGDVGFANALDLHLLTKNTYRVTHSRDPVVHIPPHNFCNYTHHKSEVWYSNNMTSNKNYTVCEDEQESKNCSAKVKYIYHVLDHLYYFNIHVSNFGKSGCEKSKNKKGIWSWLNWS